jgi:hypothetical protein
MPKQRKKAEILSRYLTVTDWRASVSVRVDRQRGLPPERGGLNWLEFDGELTEALKGVVSAKVSLHPTSDLSLGERAPLSIGSIIQIKPQVSVVVPLSEAEFDRIWTLALTNQIKSCFLAFHEPFRGYAGVVSFSVDNTLPEDE